MNYSRLKRKYKKMSTLEKDKELISNINYHGQYIFKITNNHYIKLIFSTVFFTAIFGAMLFVYAIVFINSFEQDVKYFSIGMIIILFIIIVMMIKGAYKQYTKIYPKVYLEYIEGDIDYHDGTQLYQFNSKSIHSIRFYRPCNRSRRWVLEITFFGILKYIKIDILKMNDPETLYRLLTNFNNRIKIM
ncbi:hypothetical protein HZI73_12235 [Vallitalea pronyensis]|uniref:Uncharacterized protein n=1 Tax=Vallitalea pronyensis TaxID=1348613 RepID=A0A8J8MJL8_9FIRM|nr:hypothetical protein [Vallitalea pronyensis]QUI23012.1 hypothetical protein HZI73_12235 [Vallitalea pronyensis]